MFHSIKGMNISMVNSVVATIANTKFKNVQNFRPQYFLSSLFLELS